MLLIPDDAAAGVESHLELTGGGTIAAIRIHADVIHSFIGDLSIALVSPAGTRVVLRDRAGADADDRSMPKMPPRDDSSAAAVASSGKSVFSGSSSWALRASMRLASLTSSTPRLSLARAM